MSDATAVLDPFLEDASRRHLTRAVLDALSKGHSLSLACGPGEAAARLVATLARAFPDPRAHFALVETEPVRLTMAPQSPSPQSIDASGFTPDNVLRSLLRQDMDGFAVSRIEGLDTQLLLNTVFTGHQLIAGTGASTVEAAVAALCVGSPGLEGHVLASIDVAFELDERGLIRRVVKGDRRGGLVEVDVAPVADVIQGQSAEKAPSIVRGPRAPPLDSRPAPTLAPRAAFLPQVTAGNTGRSLLGTRVAHRPAGSGWPTCRQCGAPLALVVQLDLAELPAPLPTRQGLAQLFLCITGSCEVSGETAKGVLAEVVVDPSATQVEAPESLVVEVVEPGTITGWRRFDEDPESQDVVRLGLARTDELDLDGARRPLRCDKLGGWPAWEQELDWPAQDANGAYELLFQFAEDVLLEGGPPAVRVLDPERPCHFPSILTAEAVGLLFWQPSTGRLAFRWQTG